MERWHYTWAPRPKLCPAIVTAHEERAPFPRTRALIHCPYWIIDYEFHSYGLYRTADARGPWLPRHPHVMHLYPPGLRFWEDPRHERGERHSAWIFFTGGRAAGLTRFLHPHRRYARFEDPANRLGQIFGRLARRGATLGEAGFWQAQTELCEALGLLQQACHVADETWRLAPADAHEPPTLAARVQRLLAAQLAAPVRVADVARRVGLSESSLFHRLRAAAEETPIQMLARLRVAEAKRLLLQGQPLKDIAAHTGFCDAFHLSKTFKRIEGVPPRVFRRMTK